ncbi:MAG: glycoside hydrolase family 95 protein [Bacteroidales bacterium]|nr:glycoside hydrolase family 95 protein [Bacteroidales bacterium]
MPGCKKSDRKTINILFDSPATSWYEAIPIGNGSIGGMVYGGINSDTIKINEETLWSGEPRNVQNYRAKPYLPKIRELLPEDKTNEAQKLINSVMLGPWDETYLPAGDLVLDMEEHNATNYRRKLDLNSGVVTIEYSSGGVDFKREVFASYPDKAIVMHISANKSGKISFTSSLASLLRNEVKIEGNQVILNGKAHSHSFHKRRSPYDESEIGVDLVKKYPEYEEGVGMMFQIRLMIKEKGGTTTVDKNSYIVKNADEAELILTVATSYNGFDKNPFTEGKDYDKICEGRIRKIDDVSYKKLKQNHIDDYSPLFSRVNLDLGTSPRDTLPIPERLKKYKEDGEDPGLTALYFHFGRYLLISSSRPGTQPANLQGIWSNSLTPSWSSNWTLNCNAQINYWPAEICNLSECHLPLIEMTKELSIDGAKTAKNLYGCRGWIAHHNTDIWRTTQPVGGTGMWAIYQVGSGWLCHHLWEHFEFTLDTNYLKEVYPVLKDAAIFYMDNLQRDKEDHLVTSPSISLECSYKKPDGTIGWACMGSSMDMQIIRDLFQNCREAATILRGDKDFITDLDKSLEQLLPIRISPTTGWIQPWKDDWVHYTDWGTPHGWGLYAGNQISPLETPEFADAFRKELATTRPWTYMTGGSWVAAISSKMAVRLGDGNMAQTAIDRHFKDAVLPNLTNEFGKSWQIDGNLGVTASIAEMLLQSHTGEVVLLPALPDKFPIGEVKGLSARGGFILDIKWENGKMKEVKVKSKYNNTCKLRYDKLVRSIYMKPGELIVLNGELK